MNKILPIVAVLGVSSLVALSSNHIDNKKEAFINNLNEFQESLKDYSNLNETTSAKTVFNKYNLSILNDDLQLSNKEQPQSDVSTLEIEENNEINNLVNDNNQQTVEQSIDENKTINEETINLDKETPEQISTLYSLSNDIETSCDDFCQLKTELTQAIIETEKLIEKVQSKEIDLSKEQRMFITEQSMQLKNLGKQLSNITTELSFHLSDLNQIMTTNNDNIDALNLKYLLVLDNLVNGNEMLASSLSNLNLINQMFNLQPTLPSNNQGRILYGFQHNDNPPVIKDYYIDENGEIIENSVTEKPKNTEEDAIEVENDKSNINSYKNKALKTNIDTYQNTNLPRNIDSFFNTALLDNEFMYGNAGYGGYNNFYGMQNPYINNYANYERSNAINSNNTEHNTQYVENNNNSNASQEPSKKEQKRSKLKKNIDTYKDANEPDIKTKLGNIKSSINGFFQKFKKTDLKVDLNDKIDNPIYRYNTKNDIK